VAIDFGRISGSSPASYFPAQKGRFQRKAEDKKINAGGSRRKIASMAR
jgi:hypothetical protein